jgi:hypothetical protein
MIKNPWKNWYNSLTKSILNQVKPHGVIILSSLVFLAVIVCYFSGIRLNSCKKELTQKHDFQLSNHSWVNGLYHELRLIRLFQ